LLGWGGVNQKLESKSGVDLDPTLPSEQAEEGAKNREPSARMFEQICFLIWEFRSSPVFSE